MSTELKKIVNSVSQFADTQIPYAELLSKPKPIKIVEEKDQDPIIQIGCFRSHNREICDVDAQGNKTFINVNRKNPSLRMFQLNRKPLHFYQKTSADNPKANPINCQASGPVFQIITDYYLEDERFPNEMYLANTDFALKGRNSNQIIFGIGANDCQQGNANHLVTGIKNNRYVDPVRLRNVCVQFEGVPFLDKHIRHTRHASKKQFFTQSFRQRNKR